MTARREELEQEISRLSQQRDAAMAREEVAIDVARQRAIKAEETRQEAAERASRLRVQQHEAQRRQDSLRAGQEWRELMANCFTPCQGLLAEYSVCASYLTGSAPAEWPCRRCWYGGLNPYGIIDAYNEVHVIRVNQRLVNQMPLRFE